MNNKTGDFVTLCIESLNHSKHINSLLNNGVKLLYVKREYKKLTLTVKKQDCEYVKKYFDEFNLKYEVISYSGISSLNLFFRNNLGLIIGFILSVIALFFAFNTFFSIRISALEKIDKNEVYSILLTENVKTPLFKKKIDVKSLNGKISKIDGVALSSVYLRGCVLHIDINEELEKEPIENPTFLPIVATSDCIIEQVIVERGTALVVEGQSVRKGDILIAPYFIFDKNENVTYPCEAIGKVYGRVYYEEKEEYRENRIVTEKTGNIEYKRTLIFAGKTVGEIENSKFQNYIESQDVLSIWGFPFDILEIKREETTETHIFMPFESVKEQIKEELFEKMYERVKKDVQILDKWCIIKNNMGVYIITGVLEYIDSVGVKSTQNESG